MKAIGIVTEYNPFHSGHAHMIQELRSRGYDTILCAMSGNYVQRGEPAIMEKYARAEAAVQGGVDLVLEIPTPWAMATAEIFARGGVEILQKAGCTALAFGAEEPNVEKLTNVARTLLKEDCSALMAQYLESGITYALARERAVETLVGEDAKILREANNNLAVEYIKAVLRNGCSMRLEPVQRIGAAHDGEPGETIAPASAIRSMIRQQSGQEINYISSETQKILYREIQAGRAPVELYNGERAVLSQLRKMTEEAFVPFDGGKEGLYHRVYQAVQSCSTWDEILESVKTKRYTHARIRRLLMGAFLDLSDVPKEVPYLKVLSASERGIAYLHDKKKEKRPFLTKPADVEKFGIDAKTLLELEAKRTDQFVLFYPNLTSGKMKSEWRGTPSVFKRNQKE